MTCHAHSHTTTSSLFPLPGYLSFPGSWFLVFLSLSAPPTCGKTTSWSGDRAPVTATVYHRRSERTTETFTQREKERPQATGEELSKHFLFRLPFVAVNHVIRCSMTTSSMTPASFLRVNYEHVAWCKPTMHHINSVNTVAKELVRIWQAVNTKSQQTCFECHY